jgi:hypothetical protein
LEFLNRQIRDALLHLLDIYASACGNCLCRLRIKESELCSDAADQENCDEGQSGTCTHDRSFVANAVEAPLPIAALGERKQPTFQVLFIAPRNGFVDQYFRLRGR